MNRTECHCSATTGPSGSPRALPRAVLVLGAILAVVYLLQVASPLRLKTDAIVYLSLAESAASGNGFLYRGEPAAFPLGYPLLLAGLIRAGLGSPWAFVALNLVFLAIGLAAAFWIARRAFRQNACTALLLCEITLLSYLVARAAPLPASDVPYFGLSLACLALLVHVEAGGSARWLFPALLLGVGALWTRSVGIALAPAFLWSLRSRVPLRAPGAGGRPGWRRGTALLAFAGAALLLVGGGLLLVGAFYWEAATDRALSFGSPLEAIARIGLERLGEAGQVALNVPLSQTPSVLHAAFAPAGAFAILLLLAGGWARRPRITAADAYLAAYLLILVLFPFGDPRYWFPVLPLAAVWALEAARSRPSSAAAAWLARAWFAVYLLTGILALGYTTRISLSGDRFPERFGSDGKLRPTYRVAFGQADPSRTPGVDEEALALLRRFEPRARPSRRTAPSPGDME